jgi:hypothetical protein
MKTTFATTFSIVGVLAAGGIAFAVNTSVLDNATNQFSASQALEAEVAGIVPTGIAAVVPQNQTTPSAAIVDPVATSVAPPAIVETAYNIAGVGVVTLAQNGTSLSVANVAPAGNYTNSTVNETASRVLVTFTSGIKTMKFRAEIIGDRIITSVLNETAPTATAPRPRTQDEDKDDDEDNERENHENEGEDDDD